MVGMLFKTIFMTLYKVFENTLHAWYFARFWKSKEINTSLPPEAHILEGIRKRQTIIK